MRVRLIIILLLAGSAAYSQEPVVLQKLSGSITLDGRPDEDAWDEIEPVPLVTLMPELGDPPTQRTELKITYDEQYLYVGASMWVESPDQITQKTKKRDALTGNSDYVGLVIDSFNDNENALSFFTTPTGLRFDAAIFNDAQPPDQNSMPMNLDWNTFWDAFTTVDENGWYAEMRIPFTTLRYQEVAGTITMGMTAWRYYAANNELDVYPEMDFDYGFWGAWKPSYMQKVQLTELRKKKPVYITPYLLGGMEKSSEINSDGMGYHSNSDGVFEAGLDVKYGISNNLTMDVTINTDFAQVEVDDQQLNLTRFSLFFPEKRQFFLERSSVFDFNTGGLNRLFYSRNIGIDEDGDLVRIYGGARMIGRAGKHDIGFMSMQTEAYDGEPTTNWSVLRVRRQVSKGNSYLGLMTTGKINQSSSNLGYGLDGIFNLFGSDYLNTSWVQTFDSDSSYSGVLDNSKFRLNWEKRVIAGLGYSLDFFRVGEQYNPEMGFELRNGVYRIGNRIFYGWNPENAKRLLQHQAIINGELFKYNDNNETQSLRIGPSYSFGLKSGASGIVNIVYNEENLREEFELSDETSIPVGYYSFWSLEGYYQTPDNKPLNMNTQYYFGRFFDGDRLSLTFVPVLNLSSTFEFRFTYSYNSINFKERSDRFIAHLAGVKALAMISTKFTISAFVQYNNTENKIFNNFRIRYNPREGNDLYIVYNEGYNTERLREFPTLPVSDVATFVVKYTHTFQN